MSRYKQEQAIRYLPAAETRTFYMAMQLIILVVCKVVVCNLNISTLPTPSNNFFQQNP